MTDKTDIASLMRDMRDLADRIVECQGENSDGEEIIHLYDQSDTTFKAQNILLVLSAFEEQRQQADNSSTGWLNAIAERDDARSELMALKEKHAALRESMAAIHNTIRGSGGHVSLSVLLGASEKAWRDSAPIEKSVKEKSCDKCGGSGSYHCPQMLGTVECECGIVKESE